MIMCRSASIVVGTLMILQKMKGQLKERRNVKKKKRKERGGKKNRELEMKKEKKREEEEALRRRRERQSAIARKNNTYEYNVIRVRDNLDGTCNDTQISFEIGLQAKYGWRLHSIYSNEIGKTSSPTVTGGQTNATICETVIVMERLVAFAEENHD